MKMLMIFAFLFASMAANAQEGRWKGELEIQATKLPLVFQFLNGKCTLDSPKQNVHGIEAEWTPDGNGEVKIYIPMLGASYSGKMEGCEIKGKFRQLFTDFPLNLVKMSLNRPQTPVAPFPYSTEEVKFKNGDVELNGTLTLPANSSKDIPVLLMVTGSGPQNRDEELVEHKPFAVIADAFARNGIATLRYDDRFFDDKSKDFSDFTTYDFKDDACAGVEFLRRRFSHVGVLGHSDGGTVALMLAAEGKIDFVVSLAGVGGSGKENLVLQNKAMLIGYGISSDDADKYCEVLRVVFDKMAKGESLDDLAIPNTLPQGLQDNLMSLRVQSKIPYISTLLSIDLEKSLEKIKCPVLALNGTRDMQVDCKYNLGALEKGLVNCKHKIKALDELNHMFQHCKTGAVEEYEEIEETISPEALEEMIGFIKTM